MSTEDNTWTSETSVRWAVVEHMLELVKGSELLPEGCTIEPGFVDPPPPRFVWITELTGPLDIPVFGGEGARVQRDDEFVVPFQVRIAGEADLSSAMRVVTQVCAVLENILATAPDLDGFPGVIDADITHERMTTGQTRDGVFGYGEIEVTVKARLQ